MEAPHAGGLLPFCPTCGASQQVGPEGAGLDGFGVASSRFVLIVLPLLFSSPLSVMK